MSLFKDALGALLEKSPNTARPLMTSYGYVSGSGGGGSPGVLSSMATVGWLFATIDRIASSVASSEWHLYQIRPNGDRVELFSHPLLSLWNTVNPFYTREDFLEASSQYFELTGEIWWNVVSTRSGKPLELWTVRPDRMKPIPDADKFIKGYVYTLAGHKPIPLETADVIFTRRPSPMDPYRGIGVVQAILVDLDSEKQSSKWNSNFFRNSAEPGGIIEYDGDLNDTDFDRLAARWKTQHQGVANAHRVAILERGKWIDRKITQRDMQFKDLRHVNRDIILGAFGMPHHVLGLTDTTSRANAEAGEIVFARWIVRPRLVRIRATLNAYLVPRFGDNLYMDFKDPTPANQELALDEADRGYIGGFLTKNEARARIGEGQVPGGDEFYTPPAAAPLTFSIPSPNPRRVKQDEPPELEPPDTDAQERFMEQVWSNRLEDEGTGIADYIGQFVGPGTELQISPGKTKIEIADLEGYDWDWWAKYGDDVIAELTSAISIVFQDAMPEMAEPTVQRLAANYANERGAQLLRLDGDVNMVRLTRARVNTLVSKAIDEGQGLGTLQKALREDFAFSKARAVSVARTETATALGQGVKQIAIIQDRNEKGWVTQGDDHVDSDICRANEAQGWIRLGDPFQSGHDTIPGHPLCRCNVRYRTASLEESATWAHFRCPMCNKLLSGTPRAGVSYWCPRCHREMLWVGQE